MSEAPRRVDFLPTKYGAEILIDAAWIREMPAFDASPAPYVLTFFDILLVTEGRGTFGLDGEVLPVAPGVVLFTRPGEVRRWRVEGLDGACLFFAGDFVREAFSDARFIEQFAYWRDTRPSGALALTPEQQAQMLDRFTRMREEFDGLRGDAAHLLRAGLYELLVLLNRWYVAAHGAPATAAPNARVDRFMALVERDYAKGLRLVDFARELSLTPGHLAALCRETLGRPAGAVLRGRIVLEAKRRLAHSDMPVSAIGYALGFADPPYFTRFFRRETGQTPGAFRAARR